MIATRCVNDFFLYCAHPMPGHERQLHYRYSNSAYNGPGKCAGDPEDCKNARTFTQMLAERDATNRAGDTTPRQEPTKQTIKGETTA